MFTRKLKSVELQIDGLKDVEDVEYVEDVEDVEYVQEEIEKGET